VNFKNLIILTCVAKNHNFGAQCRSRQLYFDKWYKKLQLCHSGHICHHLWYTTGGPM